MDRGGPIRMFKMLNQQNKATDWNTVSKKRKKIVGSRIPELPGEV